MQNIFRIFRKVFLKRCAGPAAVLGILTLLPAGAPAMPGMAEVSPIAGPVGAPPLRTPVDLDLSSTAPSLSAAHVANTRSVTICVGGKPLRVTPRTHLTAAEMTAVHQVIDSRRQAIRIGIQRNAVGGGVVITSRLAGNMRSLVIPRGVTVIDTAPALTLDGGLTNSGTLFAVATDSDDDPGNVLENQAKTFPKRANLRGVFMVASGVSHRRGRPGCRSLAWAPTSIPLI